MDVRRVVLILFICFLSFLSMGAFDFSPARIKYDGGDWYNDPDCLKYLAKYVNSRTDISMDTAQTAVDIDDSRMNEFPFLFMTGHGGLNVSEKGIACVRDYLNGGGFLYIDDDYGFNSDARRFISLMFPDRELIRIDSTAEIFSSYYQINRMPKIHEHYKGEAEVFGLFINGKLSILYTYNTNISDGWADYELYKDPDEKRESAKRMGVNIIYYALFK